MLVFYGLETTNMAFITLIQALCQQSFGLTLPQNCVGVHGHVSPFFLDRLSRTSRATNGGT